VQTSKSRIHMRTNHQFQKDMREQSDSIAKKKVCICRFSPQIFHPLLPISPPLARPTRVEFDIEFEQERTAFNKLCLVQESVINSLFKRKHTSQNAARMTARFTTSHETDLRNSTFGNRTLMKRRILSGMLKGYGNRCACGLPGSGVR